MTTRVKRLVEKLQALTKTQPCTIDVHVPTAGGGGRGKTFKEVLALRCAQKSLSLTVLKSTDEQLVTGWASVIEENGQPIVDWQGDVISQSDLQKAAHDFMLNHRVGKEMHTGGQVGQVVESVVLDKALQDALGINLNKIGWLIKVKVTDPEVWAKVKSGELKAFSIGGLGTREEL